MQITSVKWFSRETKYYTKLWLSYLMLPTDAGKTGLFIQIINV